MSKFREWYIKNQTEITWFVIGSLFFSTCDQLARGNYAWALFDAVMIYTNYKMDSYKMTL